MSHHIKHNQQPQTEALTHSEEKLILWWKRKHFRTAVTRVALLMLLAACCIWMYFVIGDEEKLLADLMALICFLPVAIILIWGLIIALKKVFNIRAALATGAKQIITGTLQSLTVNPKKKTLLYTIDETVTETTMPRNLRKVNQCDHLPQQPVILKILPLTAQNNLLLNITYLNIPMASIDKELASDAEKATALIPARNLLQIFRILSGITAALLAVIFVFSDKARQHVSTVLLLVFSCYSIIMLYIWLTFVFSNRRIHKSRLKATVTGIISEVFISMVDNEGAGYNSTYSYRIDGHIISGNIDDDRFETGDKVRMVCLETRNGLLEHLISAKKFQS